MRIITIKGTNIDLSESIVETVEKKLLSLARFTERFDKNAEMSVEVGKLTKHHKKGHVWRAEANLRMGGTLLRSEVTDEGFHAAVDGVKDDLLRQIKQIKGKLDTQVRKGARRAKKLTSLNPDAMYRADREVAERLQDDEEL